jgi:hypothetical protein
VKGYQKLAHPNRPVAVVVSETPFRGNDLISALLLVSNYPTS